MRNRLPRLLAALWPAAWVGVAAAGLLPQAQAATACATTYPGRYAMTDGSVLRVRKAADGQLTLRPLFFRSEQVLRPAGDDRFGIEERADRTVAFQRDAGGCVVAVVLTGFGADAPLLRLADGAPRLPAELLMDHHPRRSARALLQARPDDVAGAVRMGRTLLQRFPSRSADALAFLQELAARAPRSAAAQAALGDAFVARHQRGRALAAYRAAHALDAQEPNALTGLRRLGALPAAPGEGWTLPFPLASLFAQPTAAEMAAQRAAWAARDLAPRDVQDVTGGTLDWGGVQARVRIVSHRVHGDRHYGAIIVPAGLAPDATLPVVLDLKGVSWDYFALDVKQLLSPRILGAQAGRFIYVVPSFRGEVLRFNGVDYTSEGDRTDSWDGASDDALALLNVALASTPQADAGRVAAFGKSRGGSVALLAGLRDVRIRRVLDLAGPADWFALMASGGWTQRDIVADALRNRAGPKDDGGQFVERILAKVLDGRWGLKEARRQMLASSPLYFADGLRCVRGLYGVEDEMVPQANGRALATALGSRGLFSFHADAGHDLNAPLAFAQSRDFLLPLLDSEAATPAAPTCR